MNNKKVKIVNTNQDNKDGALICPSCSSSDVTYDIKKKVLKCNYCSFTFDEKPNSELIKSIEQENGEIRGSGTIDIKKKSEKSITNLQRLWFKSYYKYRRNTKSKMSLVS